MTRYAGVPKLWAAAHPEAWIEAYYVKDQGLTPEQGRYVALAGGKTPFPGDWSDVIAETQQTIDLLVEAAGRPRFEATSIFDLSFQHVASDVVDAVAHGQEKLLD